VASKENNNKYLEARNDDPLGYISLNKILKKIAHMFMKQNYTDMHFNQSKGVLL
jgi:hypothetical protein